MYAITGASGHTGNIVAKRLLTEGKKVRVIGRDEHRLQPLIDAGGEPFVCDLTDPGAVTKAFTGITAAYVMIPPDMTSKNYRAFQDRVTDALASALAVAGVKFAVVLSSFGADKASKTGPVVGLHNLEKRINSIAGMHVLHLRPGYFMENTLAQAGVIHAIGKTAGPLRPDLKLPMIATRDIAQVAADALLRLNFTGQNIRELHGHYDLSMPEASNIIGRAIGKPDLPYAQISDNDFRNALEDMGISTNAANLIVEMTTALNSGHMRTLEPRSPSNTTPTSYDTFVAEEFVPIYQGKLAHA